MINLLNPTAPTTRTPAPYAGPHRYGRAQAGGRRSGSARASRNGSTRTPTASGHSDRSKTPIEPYLSDQWFVRMGDDPDGTPGFAQQAMDAVTVGPGEDPPRRYAKSYLDWLGEKRDWCISRQLWWGHRIPIWYCDDLSPRHDLDARLRRPRRRRPGAGARPAGWLICSETDLDAPTTLGARAHA